MDGFGSRLSVAREARGMSQKALGQEVGVSQASIARMEGQPHENKHIFQLAKVLAVRAEWLATGDGPMEAVQVGGLSEAPASFNQLGSDFVLVPRYNIEAAAGAGALHDLERITEVMAFREDWVRRTLRVDPKQLALISATGESMEPTIRPGDLILVDTAVREVQQDGIYVIVMGNYVMCKRIQRLFAAGLVVKSDNPAYEEIRIGPDETEELIIAGRVVWIGRTL